MADFVGDDPATLDRYYALSLIHISFAAGYWLFGFASKKYPPINDMDSDAWNALNMRTRYYTTRLHVGAFYLPAFLEEMLREV